MKKFIALVLALALLCSLTACVQNVPAQSIPYGKYLCYSAFSGAERRDGNGEWLRLQPGGKGELCITEEVAIEWELSGEQEITVTAPDGQYKGMVYPHEEQLMLAKDDKMFFFSMNGKSNYETVHVTEESLLIPYTEPTETDAPTETEAPTEGNYAAYVTDAFTERFEFDGMELEYHVPEIVFDGEGIDYLNEMIYGQLYEDVYQKNVEDAINEYGMPGYAYMTYIWGISEAYLSIVVTITYYASSGAEFEIYNVDLSTGQLASQTEVLAHFGYTVDAFNEKSRDVMGSVLFDQYATFLEEMEADPSLKPMFDDLVTRTTSDEYVSDATPFVGTDGKLWMVAPIASIAGADRYAQVIEFESYPISEAYLNYIAD
ncbi:MAG: hypothetical protein IJG45_03515 [Oscillospiraceae bacterium]|nr:hypothetical protein [Oscillospiraceae bacterium]